MARYDVYAGPDGGYLLDCQSDMLAGLNSRFVVPLISEQERPASDQRLTPVFVIGDVSHTMQTHLAAAVPRHLLRTKVATLAEHQDAIGVALDLLVGRY